MLTQLHIENIAVIEKADIEFGKGLTVLTGETGAGKSIIVDSLGAVLGARTSRELVRTGAEYGVVSAVFETDAAAKWFEDNDFEPEDEIIIRRKISADGKNNCRVCGNPVTVSQLRQLGSLLLDIHGQNDGRQLMDEDSHLAYLDGFGKTSERACGIWRGLQRIYSLQARDGQAVHGRSGKGTLGRQSALSHRRA